MVKVHWKILKRSVDFKNKEIEKKMNCNWPLKINLATYKKHIIRIISFYLCINFILFQATASDEIEKNNKSVELSQSVVNNSNKQNSVSHFDSYLNKYKTALSIYFARGSYKKTSEEIPKNYTETGLSLEINEKFSLNSLRFDFNSKERKTANGSLAVKNKFNEYRVFIKRSFSSSSNYSYSDAKVNTSFFVGLGLGVVNPMTEFKVSNTTKTINSQSYLLEAALVGFNLSLSSATFLNLFAQTSFATPYPEGSLISLGVDIGASF